MSYFSKKIKNDITYTQCPRKTTDYTCNQDGKQQQLFPFTHCLYFLITTIVLQAPCSTVLVFLELFMAVKALSAGCPLHLAVYRHVFSAPPPHPPGCSLRCAFQQTKLAFLESSPECDPKGTSSNQILFAGPLSPRKFPILFVIRNFLGIQQKKKKPVLQ